jgi:hypothetical protein
MTEPTPLTDDELAAEQADLLPPREALSLLDTSALGSAYTPDGSAATPTADGGAGTGTHAAGDSATTASKLTDGTANPATGYAPSQSSTAGPA